MVGRRLLAACRPWPPCCPRAVMGRRLAPGADCFLVAFEGGRGVGAADSTDELQVEGRPEVFGRECEAFVLAVPGRVESGRHVLRSATAGTSSGIALSMPERWTGFRNLFLIKKFSFY